jgi:hypothetical protein
MVEDWLSDLGSLVGAGVSRRKFLRGASTALLGMASAPLTHAVPTSCAFTQSRVRRSGRWSTVRDSRRPHNPLEVSEVVVTTNAHGVQNKTIVALPRPMTVQAALAHVGPEGYRAAVPDCRGDCPPVPPDFPPNIFAICPLSMGPYTCGPQNTPADEVGVKCNPGTCGSCQWCCCWDVPFLGRKCICSDARVTFSAYVCSCDFDPTIQWTVCTQSGCDPCIRFT